MTPGCFDLHRYLRKSPWLLPAGSDSCCVGFAPTEKTRLSTAHAVVELKVRRTDGSRGDTPLLALIQDLRYAAVVHANHRAIAAEAMDCFVINVPDEPPIVQVLAPEDWWRGWCDMNPRTRRVAGQWESKFLELSAQLEARLGIVIECVSLEGTSLADVTWDAHGPCLEQTRRCAGSAWTGCLSPHRRRPEEPPMP